MYTKWLFRVCSRKTFCGIRNYSPNRFQSFSHIRFPMKSFCHQKVPASIDQEINPPPNRSSTYCHEIIFLQNCCRSYSCTKSLHSSKWNDYSSSNINNDINPRILRGLLSNYQNETLNKFNTYYCFCYFWHAEMKVSMSLECIYLTIYKHWYNRASKK